MPDTPNRSAARRSVVLHGHFYQPPREDPWTDRVPREVSAAPYHDWNERIHDECYRAVVAARVLDGNGHIAQVVNALEWMSWDAGPTLLRWLAREAPSTYQAFLEADARSARRTGHGNALACPYHHVILPLASRRDKVTEVRWGLEDFRRRFGREAEGMWLPETAVDTETLCVLADEGVRFTVLGPDQVDEPPADGGPARVDLPGGRSMAVFVYDGGLSHDVAFGRLLRDADAWARRMAEPDPPRALVSLATDGETFGHHHTWADMALAAVLHTLNRRDDVVVEGYAAALARRPPTRTVALVEPSSWSCAHGVGRWQEECGCRMDPSRDTSQAWRRVLRDALEALSAGLHERFADEAGALLADPWAARDAYGAVLDAGPAARRAFVAEHQARPLDGGEVRRALALLDMERDALRMFTSCGWFFDDVAGLEAIQVLRYAGHALDLLGGPAATDLEEALLARLDAAESNDPAEGTGRDIWVREIGARGTGRRAPTADGAEGAAAASGGAAVVEGGPGAESPGAGSPGMGSAVTASETTLVGGATGTDAGSGPVDVAPPPLEARLRHAVDRLVREPGAGAAREVDGLLDALAATGQAVPFEVQTRMARALGPHAPVVLRDVARHMGLAPGGVGAGGVRAPVRFVFGVHVHQPVGNFEEVFRSHVEEVYLPFLERAEARGLLPLTLHVSGPLLEWLEARGHPYLDRVARLASDGSVELLLSGLYEPVLASLPRPDRLEQIGWMRDWIARRMGVDATGLWLTERVWEPGLVEDLAEAGVAYTLVDDRHFLVAGFRRDQLHRPWRTESGGRRLSLLPIDERLRYLVPFRSPGEIGAYLEGLAEAGHPLAVLADDGEKFGGWPGTAAWVWEQGWMERFLDEMERLTERGVVRLSTARDALDAVEPAGLAYLPSASYREMEGWSLPPDAARDLHRLEDALADSEPSAATLLRGGHWRNFLARYPESNRMHAKATALSALCRERGDPADARRAIGRGQCNDAYWHGVFGGLYLRHLRAAVWSSLLEAEALLRRGQALEVEARDLYGQGTEEVWIHGQAVSVVLRPARGGALTELSWLERGQNLADVLTRRRESYHDADPSSERGAGDAVADGAPPGGDAPGSRASATASAAAAPDAGAPDAVGASSDAAASVPSIHEIEESVRMTDLPPFDLEERVLLVERVLPAGTTPGDYADGAYEAVWSWATARFAWQVTERSDAAVTVTLEAEGPGGLRKEVAVHADGRVVIDWRWDPAAFPDDAWFAPELSLAHEADVSADADGPPWRYDIVTVSRSESGAETSVQGASVTPRWPCSRGEARLSLAPA